MVLETLILLLSMKCLSCLKWVWTTLNCFQINCIIDQKISIIIVNKLLVLGMLQKVHLIVSPNVVQINSFFSFAFLKNVYCHNSVLAFLFYGCPITSLTSWKRFFIASNVAKCLWDLSRKRSNQLMLKRTKAYLCLSSLQSVISWKSSSVITFTWKKKICKFICRDRHQRQRDILLNLNFVNRFKSYPFQRRFLIWQKLRNHW